MTICPRNRHSTSRRNKKRAHQARTPKQFVTCKNCGIKKKSHVICGECGHYAGKSVYVDSGE